MFTVLAPLRPCGGGTLVLGGSYRLLRTGLTSMVGKHRLPAVRRELGGRHPWLEDLWGRGRGRGRTDGPDVDRRRRYLDEGAVLDGAPVRVVEVTGEPGDVFVMRADTFHTLAPNCQEEPRMMLIKTWLPADAEAEDD